jgi:hypothetical protein
MKNISIYPILIISVLSFTVSCTFSENNRKESRQVVLVPRDGMKVVIDSFIQFSNDKHLVYEIYIDKITPWEYNIVLYSGKESITENVTSEITTVVSNIKFSIYSGIEHYFKLSGDTLSINDEPKKRGAPDGNYWIITDKNGKLEIIKDSWAFPFYSMPDRTKFIAPKIED